MKLKHDDHDATFGPHEWTSLFRAFSDAFEWAIDLAGSLAGAYPDEVATVERVRAFVRRRVAGDPAHVRLDDLLFTLGLISGAMQRDVLPALAAAAGTVADEAPALPAPPSDVTRIAAPPTPARTMRAPRRARAAAHRGTHAIRAPRVAMVRRGGAALAAERWIH